MAHITFYQKPGCATNARQKAMLAAAGHEVIARNLLTEPWTAERLKSFFAGLPVSGWFNLAAPAVKYGEVSPEALDADDALALMLKEPLLIRRPLMETEGRRMAGFDQARVQYFLGGAVTENPVEGCSHPHAESGCPAPRETAV